MSIDTEAWLTEHRIDEVEAIIPDMAGVPRGKFFPARKFLKHNLRLPESVFLQGITGDYGEIPGDLYDIDPDLNLVPTTTRCGSSLDQRAHRQRHRRLLPAERRAAGARAAAGAQAHPQALRRPRLEAGDRPGGGVLPGQSEQGPDYPLEAPVGRAGRKEAAGRMYSIEAVNEFDPIIEDIYDYCEAMEIDADSLSHEDGAGQLEVNFLHGDPLELADQVFLFKRVAREAAFKHGIYATFMAKPMEGQPGSALHLHQSVLDVKTGKNIFSGETAATARCSAPTSPGCRPTCPRR
jgi:glutamine synthetase